MNSDEMENQSISGTIQRSLLIEYLCNDQQRVKSVDLEPASRTGVFTVCSFILIVGIGFASYFWQYTKFIVVYRSSTLFRGYSVYMALFASISVPLVTKLLSRSVAQLRCRKTQQVREAHQEDELNGWNQRTPSSFCLPQPLGCIKK